MTTYTQKLLQLYANHADAHRASAMSAYMRNQFSYFGIPSPQRRELTRAFLRDNSVPDRSDFHVVIKEWWSCEQREMQYAAMDLCIKMKKQYRKEDLALFEYLITHHSWWDTVDCVAANIVGPYFATYDDKRLRKTESWIHHQNMWLNRTAIIFQLGYKSRTDLDLLTRAILPHLHSQEFFLQKAIGWALRQYSYVNARWVKDFVAEHELKPLSKREALKAINRASESKS